MFDFFKKAPKEFPKMVVLYLSTDWNTILVVPQFVDKSWIRYEQEAIEAIVLDCSDEVLGASIKRNLDKFAEKDRPSTKRKLTDWPAYQASKLTSVQKFEKDYFRITIQGANEANLLLILEAEMKSNHNINLTSTISAYADNKELGQLVKQMHDIQLSRIIE